MLLTQAVDQRLIKKYVISMFFNYQSHLFSINQGKLSQQLTGRWAYPTHLTGISFARKLFASNLKSSQLITFTGLFFPLNAHADDSYN